MSTGPNPQNSSVPLFIGTAGWSIPALVRDAFPLEGTALQRYAAVMGCTEVNSSFHRPANLLVGHLVAIADGAVARQPA